jgi:DNA primase
VKAPNTDADDNQETIQGIMDYLSLKRILSEKLNRVV